MFTSPRVGGWFIFSCYLRLETTFRPPHGLDKRWRLNRRYVMLIWHGVGVLEPVKEGEEEVGDELGVGGWSSHQQRCCRRPAAAAQDMSVVTAGGRIVCGAICGSDRSDRIGRARSKSCKSVRLADLGRRGKSLKKR